MRIRYLFLGNYTGLLIQPRSVIKIPSNVGVVARFFNVKINYITYLRRKMGYSSPFNRAQVNTKFLIISSLCSKCLAFDCEAKIQPKRSRDGAINF